MQLGKAKVQAQPQTLIVMGVAGSGKSGVGKLLAAKLDYRLLEGDDFHRHLAKAMMAAGIPLPRAPYSLKKRQQPWAK